MTQTAISFCIGVFGVILLGVLGCGTAPVDPTPTFTRVYSGKIHSEKLGQIDSVYAVSPDEVLVDQFIFSAEDGVLTIESPLFTAIIQDAEGTTRVLGETTSVAFSIMSVTTNAIGQSVSFSGDGTFSDDGDAVTLRLSATISGGDFDGVVIDLDIEGRVDPSATEAYLASYVTIEWTK